LGHISKQAGANSVYSGEGEVALAFIEHILDGLGATREQIDRERARAHDELSGRSVTMRVAVG
jgi:CPA2 family monovalent cation:H+ antiporter-2